MVCEEGFVLNYLIKIKGYEIVRKMCLYVNNATYNHKMYELLLNAALS